MLAININQSKSRMVFDMGQHVGMDCKTQSLSIMKTMSIGQSGKVCKQLLYVDVLWHDVQKHDITVILSKE